MTATTPDATSALLQAVSASFAGFGGEFVLEQVRSRAWASVTFAGARHEIEFRLDGNEAEAAARAFLAGLSATEFHLPGHVVADIALVSETRQPGSVTVGVEALTVEER